MLAKVTEYDMGTEGFAIAYSLLIQGENGKPPIYATTDPFESVETHAFFLPRTLEGEPLHRRRYVHTSDPESIYQSVMDMASRIASNSNMVIVRDDKEFDKTLKTIASGSPLPPPGKNDTVIPLHVYFEERETLIDPNDYRMLLDIGRQYDDYHAKGCPRDEVSMGEIRALHKWSVEILGQMIRR